MVEVRAQNKQATSVNIAVIVEQKIDKGLWPKVLCRLEEMTFWWIAKAHEAIGFCA